jgi:hypothetical protein
MLNEISQTQKDKYCMTSLVFGNFFKESLTETERTMIARGWGKGKWGEVDPRAQTFSHKTNRF